MLIYIYIYIEETIHVCTKGTQTNEDEPRRCEHKGEISDTDMTRRSTSQRSTTVDVRPLLWGMPYAVNMHCAILDLEYLSDG